MALETGTYISDLNPLNPTAADPKSDGDDHLRLVKDTLRKTFPGFTGTILVGGNDTGTATAYVLTPATPLPAYSANMVVVFKAVNANTGANPTLNISGLGAKPIKDMNGADIFAGDIAAGRYTTVVYDGTNFNLLAVTKNYVQQQAFSAALPAQAGNAGKYLKTDGTAANWEIILPPQILRSPRTANTMLAAADRSTLIDITSGTFTQTFDAAATLGNGWYCWIRNGGSGDITLDPSGAETIDGLASFVMYPGEVRLIQCDGTTLRSIVVQPFSKVYVASGSLVKPPGYTRFDGEMWGAGASGGFYSNTTVLCYGGGGGAYVPFSIPASSMASSESISIGAGAGPQTADNNQYGLAGGNTTFKGMTAFGGGSNTNKNEGGSALYSGVQYSTSHVFGSSTDQASSYTAWGGGAACSNSPYGSTIYGGGGGMSFSSSNVQVISGGTKFGGAGGATSAAAGVAPGGGGAATRSGQSGAGARGELRIWGVV